MKHLSAVHIRDVTLSLPGSVLREWSLTWIRFMGKGVRKILIRGWAILSQKRSRRNRARAKASWVPLVVLPKGNSRPGPIVLSGAWWLSTLWPPTAPDIEASYNYTLTKLSSLGIAFPWAVEPC